MDNRLKNGSRNIMAGMINRVVLMILPFVFRTVVVYTVGTNYLGLSTLFTSLINVLSLSELGFGAALVYSMYKPIIDNDYHKICSILNFYKKIYLLIGFLILLFGLILTPVIPYLIKSDLPDDVNIYVLYFLTLLNSASSYFFFAYKSALLMAYQRKDVISNVGTVTGILMYVVQIILLYCTHNYYCVVISLLFTTIINNLWVAFLTNKLYPQYVCEGKLNKKDLSDIWQRVKGIALQKLCSISRNALDSIVVSMNMGLVQTAKYGNYFTIFNAVHLVLYQIPLSIVSSVGNSVASESVKKNFLDFRKFNYIYMWISGVFICCALCVCQPFMEIWMGKANVFPIKTVVLFCIYFYELSMVDILYVYRDAVGLWWHGRYATVLEASLNLILNFLLGYIWGVNGVLIATIITVFLITVGYYGYIIFKKYFGLSNIILYIKDDCIYIVSCFVAAFISYKLCATIHAALIMELFLCTLISFFVCNAIFFLLLKHHTCYDESIKLMKSIKNTLVKRG